MMRRVLAILLVAGAVLLALAAPAQGDAATSTVNFHNDVFPIEDIESPCTPVVGTSVIDGVLHETVSHNGSEHLTGTLTGSFDVQEVLFGTFTPTGRTATGHFTAWFGANINVVTGDGGVKLMFWDTLNVKGELSDGSPVDFNIVGQFRQAPDGTITLDFIKPKCKAV